MLIIKDNEVLEYKELHKGRKEYSNGKPLRKINSEIQEVKSNTPTDVKVEYLVFDLESESYIKDVVNKTVEVFEGDVSCGNLDIIDGIGLISLTDPNTGYIRFDIDGGVINAKVID